MASRIELTALNRLRHLFGKFNLTELERSLIERLLKSASPEMASLIESQLEKFNRVRRLLQDDDRLECGSTTFYWHRFGKSRFDEFDRRLPFDDEGKEQIIGRCLVTDSQARQIEVKFHTLMGVFNQMSYWSDDRVWYPVGPYDISEVMLHGD